MESIYRDRSGQDLQFIFHISSAIGPTPGKIKCKETLSIFLSVVQLIVNTDFAALLGDARKIWICTFSLTHKMIFSIVIPIKSNVLSHTVGKSNPGFISSWILTVNLTNRDYRF